VKCEHHAKGCAWTGSAPGYESHKNSCSYEDKEDFPYLEVIRLLEKAKKKIQKLEARNKDLKSKNENMTSRLSAAETTKEELESRYCRLEQENQEIRNIIEQPSMNFKGGYIYDRHSVAQLTKLICQNLENKPDSIDSNKIFDCVKNTFSDLQKNWNDNPQDLYIDVRMLLAVCCASTWFSTNQRNQINNMSEKKGWG